MRHTQRNQTSFGIPFFVFKVPPIFHDEHHVVRVFDGFNLVFLEITLSLVLRNTVDFGLDRAPLPFYSTLKEQRL